MSPVTFGRVPFLNRTGVCCPGVGGAVGVVGVAGWFGGVTGGVFGGDVVLVGDLISAPPRLARSGDTGGDDELGGSDMFSL